MPQFRDANQLDSFFLNHGLHVPAGQQVCNALTVNGNTFITYVDYTEYEEGIYVGYRWFDKQNIAVSYPFGYGLSYTGFEWSGASVKAGKKETVVYVDVKNVGSVAGKDVVQLYVTAPSGEIDKPVKELKAFAKTKELAPGESQRVTLRISNSDLASYNESQNAWIVDEGEYSFLLGASSRDIRATVTANVNGSVTKTNALDFNK